MTVVEDEKLGEKGVPERGFGLSTHTYLTRPSIKALGAHRQQQACNSKIAYKQNGVYSDESVLDIAFDRLRRKS